MHREERFYSLGSTTSSSGTLYSPGLPDHSRISLVRDRDSGEVADGDAAGEVGRHGEHGQPFWRMEVEPLLKNTGSR